MSITESQYDRGIERQNHKNELAREKMDRKKQIDHIRKELNVIFSLNPGNVDFIIGGYKAVNND